MAALAKSCHIDRSTMFQYVHGKRPLKNQEHLERIMNRISLTLPERKEWMEVFEIEKIGYERFFRRRKVEQFIRTLPSMSQKQDDMVWKLWREGEKDGLHSGYIGNHLELSQILFRLLCIAHEQGEPVNILMQPQKASLLDVLMHPAFIQSNIRVSHIVCLDNLKNDSSGENIDRFHMLIRYFMLLEQYQPVYFYGNTKERFGLSNPFPYFISTKNWVLQIASDESMGILHTDVKTAEGFQKLFLRISDCCQPLGAVFAGLGREINWYESYVNSEMFQNAIELCTGLCSTQFWDTALINTYLNPQLPGAAKLREMLSAYCRKLYESKREGQVRILLNPVYVQEFMQTGWFKEYPKVFFARPLGREDRRIILERVLEACEEGWYQICFLEESQFPLQCRWELCANSEVVTIQYFHQEQFRTLFIQECGFVEDVYGYMESLWKSEGSVSGKEAVQQLRDWMGQYLS